MPNRVLLADRLQQSLGQCLRLQTSLAVVVMDLDGFKTVNDRCGQDAGDELLMVLARRMGDMLQTGDTLARIGGDEFVAVLVGQSVDHCFEQQLQRLLEAAATAVTLQGQSDTLRVSASMGWTTYPQDPSDVDGLLRHADQAMYLAKQAGKNRYHLFDTAQDAAVTTQQQTLEHIRLALLAQQFVLHYQPKVNMRSGKVIGAEALIRWQHPQRGLLAPGAFLPVIENHPLSVDLGEWVIANALQQMRQWQTLGLELAVSVNIGARQLQQENFSSRLAALLATYPDIAPSRLELEILETSALEDIAWVSRVMVTCQGLGVRFALDDFGTGYSSLTYLKRLPAEMLKIDQSFVRDMLIDRDDLSIVQTVIGLAEAFHRGVIAEGVETTDHGTALLRMGCELAQGYGVARPMPADKLPDWVAHWRPDPSWTEEDDPVIFAA
ncbi:MAG: bifunctional diguanylate cyclase/phosphodiesterase [Rhodoferax sp.]|nr:bifunctional diguanylate cyclase/phosphodiesterase [Rhodoferax sp.]